MTMRSSLSDQYQDKNVKVTQRTESSLKRTLGRDSKDLQGTPGSTTNTSLPKQSLINPISFLQM